MTESSKKSFWKKPEGTTGIVILILIALLLFGIALPLLSQMISGGVIALTVLIVALGIGVFILFDKRARSLVSLSFQRLSRWITSWFTDVDPMKVLQSQITEMEDNLRKMKRQMTILRGQIHKLTEQIMNNEDNIHSHLENASKAKKSKEESSVIINTRRAARLRESNEKLTSLLNRMKALHKVLKRMKSHSIILLTDIKDQVELKEKERKAMLAGNSAMKSAMAILSGESNQKEKFDEALEEVADDMSQKVGEMEKFMDLSQSFMKSIDLKNGVFEEDGLKMLEEFEKENATYFKEDLQSLKDIKHLDDGNQRDELNISDSSERTEEIQNEYDTLFDFDNKKSDG